MRRGWVGALLGLLTTPSVRADDPPGTEARVAPPQMVRLSRAEVRLGSTREEVVEAALLCNREANAPACTPDDFASELDGPQVLVESFWLDRHEVSSGDYAHCVRQGRCRPLPYEKGGSRFERPELPAVFVTWYEASEYCAFRDARLPTEAEFERAARGPLRRRFPWGDLFHSSLANHGRAGVSQTEARDGYEELAPVSAFEAGRSPEGVLQLAGTVAEWTSSHYLRYDAPEGSPQTGERVVRGGHYLRGPAWLRGAARLSEHPNRRAAYLGFRCARSHS